MKGRKARLVLERADSAGPRLRCDPGPVTQARPGRESRNLSGTGRLRPGRATWIPAPCVCRRRGALAAGPSLRGPGRGPSRGPSPGAISTPGTPTPLRRRRARRVRAHVPASHKRRAGARRARVAPVSSSLVCQRRTDATRRVPAAASTPGPAAAGPAPDQASARSRLDPNCERTRRRRRRRRVDAPSPSACASRRSSTAAAVAASNASSSDDGASS